MKQTVPTWCPLIYNIFLIIHKKGVSYGWPLLWFPYVHLACHSQIADYNYTICSAMKRIEHCLFPQKPFLSLSMYLFYLYFHIFMLLKIKTFWFIILSVYFLFILKFDILVNVYKLRRSLYWKQAFFFLLLLHLDFSTLVHQIQVPTQLNYFLQFTATPLVCI